MHKIAKRITLGIIETTVVGVSSSILIDKICDNLRRKTRKARRAR